MARGSRRQIQANRPLRRIGVREEIVDVRDPGEGGADLLVLPNADCASALPGWMTRLTAYMKTLFDYGYARGRAGYRWRKAPPILEAAAS